MKKVNGCTWISLLAISAFAVAHGTMGSAKAQEGTTVPSSDSAEIAQGLVGQCRAAKRPIFIYSERSTTSNRVRSLSINEQVTLADNGGSGWIAVNAPVTGFVQTADLKLCTQAPPPPPPPPRDLCRRTTVDLNVRERPNVNARVIRLLRAGQQITLRTGQETTDADGRVWAEISSPVAGWISTRPDEGRSNITNCTNNSPPPPPPPAATKMCRVLIPQGLRIWSSPTGNPVGTLVFNQSATLTGQRQVIGNRVWVQISSPRQAWISSGFVNSENNISCR
jgi:hypothetical protein